MDWFQISVVVSLMAICFELSSINSTLSNIYCSMPEQDEEY